MYERTEFCLLTGFSGGKVVFPEVTKRNIPLFTTYRKSTYSDKKFVPTFVWLLKAK
jgi:hypothetical protein